jgi:hypothetical protein
LQAKRARRLDKDEAVDFYAQLPFCIELHVRAVEVRKTSTEDWPQQATAAAPSRLSRSYSDLISPLIQFKEALYLISPYQHQPLIHCWIWAIHTFLIRNIHVSTFQTAHPCNHDRQHGLTVSEVCCSLPGCRCEPTNSSEFGFISSVHACLAGMQPALLSRTRPCLDLWLEHWQLSYACFLCCRCSVEKPALVSSTKCSQELRQVRCCRASDNGLRAAALHSSPARALPACRLQCVRDLLSS